MKNIAVKITYDGSAFHGWQRQKNGISVQQTVEEALGEITGESVSVTGCSRTDAGVHALEYVFNFKTESTVPPDRIWVALNTKLPCQSVAALGSAEVSDEFDARFCAKGKTYVYYIFGGAARSPFIERYCWRIPRPLELSDMQAAARAFEGRHDFAGFVAAGGSQKTTERTVSKCEVYRLPENPDILALEITADAFLYNMVRIITGTVAYVGAGRLGASEIPSVIESCDRSRAGITAPPNGLFLKKVYYENFKLLSEE